MQRFFDIVFSGIALVFLAPLLLPLKLILRVTGEGEIFFLQNRIGREGKHCKLYKFTTMLKDSIYKGTGTITIKNDPRVLLIDRFLPKTKINELPQLINILNGDTTVSAFFLKGHIFDCEDNGRYILANLEFAMKVPAIKTKIKNYLNTR